MQPIPIDSFDPDAPDPINDVPIQVRVVAGEFETAVGTLSAIRPGDVFELSGSVVPKVTLWVGRRLIAEGELVDQGGRLSVEITRIGRSR